MKNNNPGRFSKSTVLSKQSGTKKSQQETWLGVMGETPALDINNDEQYSIPERQFEESRLSRQPTELKRLQERSEENWQSSNRLTEHSTMQQLQLQKSSVDLIQTVLTRMTQNHLEVNPYYSKQTVSRAISLLKSHSKLNSYAMQLEVQSATATPQVRAAYGVLSLLLSKLDENWSDMQLQVSEDQSDFELTFGDGALDQKESELAELKKQLTKKEEEAKEVDAAYLQTISNLNDAMASLTH